MKLALQLFFFSFHELTLSVNIMGKKILIFVGLMLFSNLHSIQSFAGASCMHPRCHSVGEGYCLPGHQISFRSSCGFDECLIATFCGSSPMS